MAGTAVPTKDLREWEKRFRPGYEIGSQDGAGHWTIVGPDGEVVRYETGKPVTLASTPKSGGPHYQRRITQMLQSAGVIESNGRKPMPKRTPAQNAAIIAKREATLAPKRDAMHARAVELYEKMNVIIERLGGWEVDGLQADISRVAMELSDGRFDVGQLQPSLNRIRHQGGVSDTYYEVWTKFIEEMDRENPGDHFYTLVRLARGLPVSPVSPTKAPSYAADEWPFVVQLVPLSVLTVDHRYQRPVHWPFVRRLASTFDERLVGAIDCAQRRGETLAIMDGQLRYEAMRLKGKKTCWVAVYPQMGVEAEARFFLHKNRDRKTIHPFYIYRAELTSGTKEAVAIDKIMKGSRYTLSSASGSGKNPDQIGAIAAIRDVYHRSTADTGTIYHRPECLTPTLHWLGKTMYGKPGGTNSVLIRALGRFFGAYTDDELELHVLEGMLAATLPEFILSRAAGAVGLAGTSGKSGRSAVVIAQEYNDRVPKESRLDLKRLRLDPLGRV